MGGALLRRARWWRAAALAGVGVVIAAGVSTAAPALSSPPDASETPTTTSATEPTTTLHPDETSYPQLAYFDEFAELPGFVSGGVDPAADSGMEIYWHGDLTADAYALIASAEADGTAIRIVEVSRSTDEIWAACLELARALDADGIEVGGFGPNRLNTTIELMGPELSTSPELQARAQEIAAETIGTGYLVAFLPNETGFTF